MKPGDLVALRDHRQYIGTILSSTFSSIYFKDSGGQDPYIVFKVLWNKRIPKHYIVDDLYEQPGSICMVLESALKMVQTSDGCDRMEP